MTSVVTRLGTNFSRIIQQINCKQTVLSPNKTTVFIPGGFPYEAFNPRACITPWSLIKMVECARGASFSANFLNAQELYKNYFIFIVSTSTAVSPDLYDLSVTKGPLVQDVTLDYVGNTSFKLTTVMSIEGMKNPICENQTQSVFVNINTRKPAPPPEWWTQKYSLGLNNKEPLKLVHPEPPSGEMIQKIHLEVPASDVDPYLHVNWSNYIKYFYESYIQYELRKKSLKDANHLFRNIKNFSVSYIHESNIGDKLSIKLWEDINSQNCYHFQMLKGQKVVNESSIEFFPVV
ncbi:hypothetical protein BgiMline_026488 [Biomphalaria glabrata]|nr:hypothetical protein BgiMline_020965 [Biomphalaria glabrata]